MMKPLHWISCACVTAAGMFFSFATAGAAGIQARGTKPIIDQSTESFVTGDLGVNFLSQYVARGIVFENEGVIAQPYADRRSKRRAGCAACCARSQSRFSKA